MKAAKIPSPGGRRGGGLGLCALEAEVAGALEGEFAVVAFDEVAVVLGGDRKLHAVAAGDLERGVVPGGEEFVCVVLLWWWVTSMRLETMVASTVRRGELLFLCQRPMPRTAVTMNMMKMPTNMTVKITGKTEFIKSKPNIAGPLFLFVSTIYQTQERRASSRRKKRKTCGKSPLQFFPACGKVQLLCSSFA